MPVVEVVVGEDAVVWYLHETLLIASSEFFKAAIKHSFKEGTERRIVLAEDGNAAFQLFVQYLYTQAFQSSSLQPLIEAYVLGDKLGASEFRRQALDKVYALNLHQCRFTAEHVL